eukprot:843497-Amphidinium_carterae.2
MLRRKLITVPWRVTQGVALVDIEAKWSNWLADIAAALKWDWTHLWQDPSIAKLRPTGDTSGATHLQRKWWNDTMVPNILD